MEVLQTAGAWVVW